MIEKKYNSVTGQPLLNAIKLPFFFKAIHHRGKEACSGPYVQNLLPCFELSKRKLASLPEHWTSSEVKRTLIKIEKLPTSFTGKSPDVIVCEVTEMKPGENWLTGSPDCGIEEAYQLPESGPPRQSGWSSMRKYRGRKIANQSQTKSHLDLGLWVVKQRLSWPSMEQAGLALAWEDQQRQLAYGWWRASLSSRWNPYYTWLYPNTYYLHFQSFLRGRWEMFVLSEPASPEPEHGTALLPFSWLS